MAGGRDGPPGWGPPQPPAFIPGQDQSRRAPGSAPPASVVQGGGGGMPLPGGPGGFGGLAGAGASLSISPADEVKPPSPIGQDIGGSGVGTGFTSANTPALIPGIAATVPAGNVGVVRSVVFQGLGLLATSRIFFTVLVNGGPVEGFNNVLLLPGVLAVAAATFGPEETYIRIPENNTVEIRVQVTDGGTYQLGALFHGWFYSKELAQVFTRAYQV